MHRPSNFFTTCIKRGRCRNHMCLQGCDSNCDIQNLFWICILVALRRQLPALSVTLGGSVKQIEFAREPQQTDFDFRMFQLCCLEMVQSKISFCRYKFWTATKDPQLLLRICLPVEILSDACLDVWIVFSEVNGAQFALGNQLARQAALFSNLSCLTSMLNLPLQRRNSGAVGTLAMPIITTFCCCIVHVISTSCLNPFKQCTILAIACKQIAQFSVPFVSLFLPPNLLCTNRVTHPNVLKVSAGAGSWMLRQALRFVLTEFPCAIFAPGRECRRRPC